MRISKKLQARLNKHGLVISKEKFGNRNMIKVHVPDRFCDVWLPTVKYVEAWLDDAIKTGFI